MNGWRFAVARAEGAAFLCLVLIVALRPLISETYDSSGTPFAEAIPEIAEPSPLRTLVFDSVILGSLAVWFFARRYVGNSGSRNDKPFESDQSLAAGYRKTGLEWGLVLLMIAGVVSCASSGNKRLAVNASIDWLCYPALTIALFQLAHREWHRRLILAAIIGTASAQAMQCADQFFITHPQTIEQYERTKFDFWAKQDVEMDSSKVELFERRMLAREASGYLPHSNIAGSQLVLCGLTALGVAVAAWKRTRRRGATPLELLRATGCTIAAAGILAATLLTGSRGAIVSCAIGIAFWIASSVMRAWWVRRPRMTWLELWVGAVLCIGAVIVVGLLRGGLPGASLQFRWEYWTASVRLFADHWLTGVGRENFGRHYLQYKSIASPEEITNPHNLFVQAASDWGLLGLAGIVALLLGVSWIMCVGPSHNASKVRDRETDEDGGPKSLPALYLLVGIALLVTRNGLLGSADPSYRLWSAVSVGVPWFLGSGLIFFARPGETNGPIVRGGIRAGLIALLVHDMINFALFVPATATGFFALLAVALPRRDLQPSGKPITRHWTVGLGALAGVALISIVGLWPVAEATALIHALRMDRGGAFAQPKKPFTRLLATNVTIAAEADPLDPTPYVAGMDALLSLAPDSAESSSEERIQLLTEWMERAIRRDPFHLSLHRKRTHLLRASASEQHSATIADQAVESARKTLSLYPQDPQGWMLLGDCLLVAGKCSKSLDLAREAADALRHALTLDDSRPAWETIRRLRDRERKWILERIDATESLLRGMAIE